MWPASTSDAPVHSTHTTLAETMKMPAPESQERAAVDRRAAS